MFNSYWIYILSSVLYEAFVFTELSLTFITTILDRYFNSSLIDKALSYMCHRTSHEYKSKEWKVCLLPLNPILIPPHSLIPLDWRCSKKSELIIHLLQKSSAQFNSEQAWTSSRFWWFSDVCVWSLRSSTFLQVSFSSFLKPILWPEIILTEGRKNYLWQQVICCLRSSLWLIFVFYHLVILKQTLSVGNLQWCEFWIFQLKSEFIFYISGF